MDGLCGIAKSSGWKIHKVRGRVLDWYLPSSWCLIRRDDEPGLFDFLGKFQRKFEQQLKRQAEDFETFQDKVGGRDLTCDWVLVGSVGVLGRNFNVFRRHKVEMETFTQI